MQTGLDRMNDPGGVEVRLALDLFDHAPHGRGTSIGLVVHQSYSPLLPLVLPCTPLWACPPRSIHCQLPPLRFSARTDPDSQRPENHPTQRREWPSTAPSRSSPLHTASPGLHRACPAQSPSRFSYGAYTSQDCGLVTSSVYSALGGSHRMLNSDTHNNIDEKTRKT